MLTLDTHEYYHSSCPQGAFGYLSPSLASLWTLCMLLAWLIPLQPEQLEQKLQSWQSDMLELFLTRTQPVPWIALDGGCWYA